MTELLGMAPGLLPTPPWLDGPSTDDPERRARRRAELVTQQLQSGLDCVVTEPFPRRDLLASLLLRLDSVVAGPPRRWPDSSARYRQPVVTGSLSSPGDEGGSRRRPIDRTSPDAVAPAELLTALPGPYTLSRLVDDEHYGDDRALLDGITTALRNVLRRDVSDGVVLLEPALTWERPDEVMAHVSDAVDAVANATSEDVLVHVSGDALSDVAYAHLLDAGFDALGVDLVADSDGWRRLVNEYGVTDDVALGVVDARSTTVESASLVGDRVDWWVENTPVASFDRIYVTAGRPLFEVSWRTARSKLAALGAATE